MKPNQAFEIFAFEMTQAATLMNTPESTENFKNGNIGGNLSDDNGVAQLLYLQLFGITEM